MRPILANRRLARRRSAVLALFPFVFLSALSFAQVRVGYDGPLPVTKDADLSQEMLLGTPEQLTDLLTALGVDPALIPKAVSPDHEANVRVETVAGTDARLLFLPCSGPGSPHAYFYLLQLNKDQHWHAADHIALDCWWKSASYEWIQVQGKPWPSLLAHHVNHDHGSGEVKDYMHLYEIRGNRLVKVLETEEETSETKMGSSKVITQAASLLPFPDGSLEETRIISDRDESGSNLKNPSDSFVPMHIAQVERRRWRWNASAKNYTSGEFTTIAR
jgi:hypothetical protein